MINTINKVISFSKFSKKPAFIEIRNFRYLEHCGPNYDDNLNYRNLVVRKALNELRGTASLDPTLFFYLTCPTLVQVWSKFGPTLVQFVSKFGSNFG